MFEVIVSGDARSVSDGATAGDLFDDRSTLVARINALTRGLPPG